MNGRGLDGFEDIRKAVDIMRSEPGPIAMSEPHLGGSEWEFVREAFETNWVGPLGPHVNALEREFADVVGSRHAVATSSGTAAVHLALALLGVQSGHEVFVSTLTFVASANPIVYQGARPVFVDSERTSWNMDPDLLERALRRRSKTGKLPKAVMVVHIYGQSADLTPILEVCHGYDIPVIEDAAEALGASYKGRHPGSLGRIGVFSFNGNKIITTGGGGMLVTDTTELADRARKLATQARDSAPHYEHSEIGYNYRLSNILAGFGRGQLRVLEDRVMARRRNFDYYRQHLDGITGLAFMPEASWGRSTRWLSCIAIDSTRFGADREIVRQRLLGERIESRPVWKPMHLQPLFQECEVIGGRVSEEIFEQGLCLPSGSNLAESDLARVVKVIQSCAK